ncbi:MAG: ATP-binding protein [Actinobacteria bacterium]|nr:ATP-binding protein [Actinomycetota bacterium]
MINLNLFNPWWSNNEVRKDLVGKKRKIFSEVYKYINLRQILIFTGLRRVGKTTLMFQIIDFLISDKNIHPIQILYFSFDESIENLEEILKNYETEILKEKISTIQVYLFFDEVQKLENWPSKIKIIYDLYPNVKIFLSGSAAINLKKGTRESLAGRYFDFVIETLDFDEYLEFKNIKLDKERENIHEVDIRKNFDNFLFSGGFVEALDLDSLKLKKYFSEGLIERVIYRDLPGVFSINYPDLLYKLVNILAERPGIYLEYKNIANDLKYDQRTISAYLSYLEYSMLINKIYNYSENFITSEKKIKRAYLSNTAFTAALTDIKDYSLFIEQFFINFLKAKKFYRNPQKEEIDIILKLNDKILPVEVKIKNEIKSDDLNPIFKFLGKFNLNKGLIITKNNSNDFIKDNRLIKAIPYWKYWSLKKELYINK